MKLEGPYFNTTGWEQDFNGLHPVNMLANIAKFQNKIEAKYEPFRGYVQKTGDGNFKKIVTCTYDNIIAHGNGKLEKQAKLVSARNMIIKLKQIDIGIVNETLASGITTDNNPHKKPVVQQFKKFKSAGTLESSFVAASTAKSESDIGKPSGYPNSNTIEKCDEYDKDVKQYKAYLEGKILEPKESLASFSNEELDTGQNNKTQPKIVFKRQSSDIINSKEIESKKIKFDDKL